jgi:hypothetical protein
VMIVVGRDGYNVVSGRCEWRCASVQHVWGRATNRHISGGPSFVAAIIGGVGWLCGGLSWRAVWLAGTERRTLLTVEVASAHTDGGARLHPSVRRFHTGRGQKRVTCGMLPGHSALARFEARASADQLWRVRACLLVYCLPRVELGSRCPGGKLGRIRRRGSAEEWARKIDARSRTMQPPPATLGGG